MFAKLLVFIAALLPLTLYGQINPNNVTPLRWIEDIQSSEHDFKFTLNDGSVWDIPINSILAKKYQLSEWKVGNRIEFANVFIRSSEVEYMYLVNKRFHIDFLAELVGAPKIQLEITQHTNNEVTLSNGTVWKLEESNPDESDWFNTLKDEDLVQFNKAMVVTENVPDAPDKDYHFLILYNDSSLEWMILYAENLE